MSPSALDYLIVFVSPFVLLGVSGWLRFKYLRSESDDVDVGAEINDRNSENFDKADPNSE